MTLEDLPREVSEAAQSARLCLCQLGQGCILATFLQCCARISGSMSEARPGCRHWTCQTNGLQLPSSESSPPLLVVSGPRPRSSWLLSPPPCLSCWPAANRRCFDALRQVQWRCSISLVEHQASCACLEPCALAHLAHLLWLIKPQPYSYYLPTTSS